MICRRVLAVRKVGENKLFTLVPQDPSYKHISCVPILDANDWRMCATKLAPPCEYAAAGV